MPERHRHHQDWTPERLLNWANDIGQEVYCFIQSLLNSKEHPEQAYRASLGLLNLHESMELNDSATPVPMPGTSGVTG